MLETFDLIVIGTGAGGATAAYRCRESGWRVAVVDELPYGGTCALRGCDPKKVLVGAAELVDWQRRMSVNGVEGSLSIDWSALMRFKRTFTEPVPANREESFTKAGITTLHGTACFTAPDSLVVNGVEFSAHHFLLAVGSQPRSLDIPGAEALLTSADFLDLQRLPRRIAFVGGGYISFEFAHLARRAGAEVTIIGRGRPLRLFDHDLVDHLVQHTRNLGIVVKDGREVTAVETKPDGVLVLQMDNGETVTADIAVHGAGRVPATAGMGLDVAEIDTEPNGSIRVNEYLRSPSNRRVYAAGDAAEPPGSAALTPVGGYESRIVAANLLGGDHLIPDYRGIPSVVFTIPPLVRVGLSEQEARAEGLDIEVKQSETSGWYSNLRVNETCAMFKTLVERETDQIIGAHIIGLHAEELINLFGFAIRQGLPASAMRQQLYAYPTVGSEAAYML
ncbi:MAG: NAD(P)/FAD-dependent oxidoreductase [Anaerolineales bacterium]|nr:NAD(P)/FAD-dependent oxidoreductase [Anaerolineales bacterium]